MISFPPVKINLGLRVLSKRADNYHNLETCFYPVSWTDALEIVPAQSFSFTTSGDTIPGDVAGNLCVKAYHLLKKDFGLTEVSIHLHKVIPTGAGLGGGSSDGAHALLLLNQVFDLGLTPDQLKPYALQLGSDCPFFIENKPMLGTGRGEVLEQVQVDLGGTFIVLVKPDVHVSTQEAYAGITPSSASAEIRAIVETQPLSQWKQNLKNDFELSVFKKYPVISSVKDTLYQQGAVYASMSGSGASVFGLFKQPVDLKSFFPGMRYWSSTL